MSFSGKTAKKGQDQFVSRLYDLMDQCSRGNRPVMTSFLSLSEQETARRLCREYCTVLDGGYPEAERKRLLISEWPSEDGPEVCCLKAVLPPRSAPVTHQQVLGTLMHEGIKREALGDFVCTDQAVWIFCTGPMARYIQEQVCRIGGVSLHFDQADAQDMPVPQKEAIRINVSSLRTDAVVAALAHCSRSRAMEMIRQGFVKVNDVVLDDNGRLCNNDVISVRHTGRFQFAGEVSRTRKDRLVLEFYKYT